MGNSPAACRAFTRIRSIECLLRKQSSRIWPSSLATRSLAPMGWRACGDSALSSPEPAGDMGVERAQGLRLGAFGAARAVAGVPRHHIDMCPGYPGIDKFLQIERRGDRPGMRRFRHVVDVGHLAV